MLLTAFASLYELLPGPWWYVRDLTMILSFSLAVWSLGCSRTYHSARLASIGVLFASVAAFGARDHFWRYDFRYSRIPLPADHPVYLVEDVAHQYALPFPVYLTSQGVTIRIFVPLQERRIVDILRQFSVPPGHWIANVPGQTCNFERLISQQGEILLRSGHLLADPPNRGVFDELTLVRCAPGERCTYRYRTALNSCFSSNAPSALATTLAMAGLKEFILIETNARDVIFPRFD